MFTKLRNIVQSKTNPSEPNVSNNSTQISQLAPFDECIEACDAQASSTRNNINITDCSVLVSPDGNLLFVPTSQDKASTKELFKEEEYESAVRVGCDKDGGDYRQNGFTTTGLDVATTSEVLDKSTRALTVTARFVEQVMLAEKEGRAHTTSACDKLRNAMIGSTGSSSKMKYAANIMGPLFHPGTSLQKALLELESYHTTCCEEELVRYWKESREEGGGVLPRIQAAAVKSHNRATKRRIALHNSMKAVENAETLLKQRKDELANCNKKVMETKKAAKARWLEMKKDRIHEMEVLKLEKNVGEVQFEDGEKENLWEMIHAVGEQQDFEPTASSRRLNDTKEEIDLPPLPTLSDVESDMNLVIYKNLAVDAEHAVEDASASLLNALSSLDTTYRSSRIAAESCLLSAAHAQQKCLQQLVQMERESLEQRLIHLQKVEMAVDRLNVRRDLDLCLGKGDAEYSAEVDGGIASSMAIINCYCGGNKSGRSDEERREEGPIAVISKDSSLLEGWGDGDDEEEVMSNSDIEELTNHFFSETTEEEIQHAVTTLEKAVQSSKSRMYKAGICHALNLKRSTQTKINSSLQFDALSQVLKTVLSNSDCRNTEDVANAKICMMMAQTFYKGDERTNRIYLKTNLIPHDLWNNNNFWEQALFQLVSESLVQSGVMEHYGPALKWHDLTSKQRMEAASQLHALVFSQLGALAHSMMEFGCSVDMTCVFVRQMSIRHQLPISQRMVLLQHILGGEENVSSLVENKVETIGLKDDETNGEEITLGNREESDLKDEALSTTDEKGKEVRITSDAKDENDLKDENVQQNSIPSSEDRNDSKTGEI